MIARSRRPRVESLAGGCRDLQPGAFPASQRSRADDADFRPTDAAGSARRPRSHAPRRGCPSRASSLEAHDLGVARGVTRVRAYLFPLDAPARPRRFGTAVPSSATGVSNGVFSACASRFLEGLRADYLEISNFVGRGRRPCRRGRGVFRAGAATGPGANPGGQGTNRPSTAEGPSLTLARARASRNASRAPPVGAPSVGHPLPSPATPEFAARQHPSGDRALIYDISHPRSKRAAESPCTPRRRWTSSLRSEPP